MISGGGASANIFLNFAEAASATALVAAHTGEPIYYELATPIEYELVEPMLNSGWIDENGTMRVVYEDESEPHVLFKSDITYGVNTGDALHSLNSKIDAYQTDTENKFNLYETIDSVKSKGNASTPVYFDASGTAQPITSYSGNAATATEIDTEVKTGQKFVYRQAVNTKKVNTLGIDKIAGKTLVWNQLMPNGNFVDTPDGWGAYSGAQKSIADGVCTLLATQAGSSIRRAVPSISGHKYYIATSIKTTSNLVGINIAGSIGTKATGTNSWERVANIWTSPTDNPSLYIGVGDNRTADWDNVLFTNFVFIDLTKMFGAGNEPSTVAEFKSMFPNSYYPYSPGSLISNDASALETVGFNQWDEKWELGDIGANTGQNVPYNGCIRSTNYNPCFSNTEYYITSAGKQGRLFWYDANKNFISAFQFGDNRLATSPSNACYFRFAMFNAYGTTYGNDICINLSDASRNGQYEPYWKRTLPLNLNSFKVKSPNIWDEQTEEGTIDSDGDPVASSGTLRTVHYIPVTPGKEYYIKLPLITELVVNPFFYDANKVFVKQLGSGIINETFVVPEGCWYMKIAFPIEYGSTYGNNVCINESGWANGRYFSHEDITITGGLKGAESVYDEIVGNKYVKRVGGSVDLGSLTYTKGEAGEHYRFGASVTGIKRAVNASTKGNIICAAFENIDPYASYIGIYGIAVAHNEDKVFISGSAYDSMTEEQVKAAFNGIYLVFELATLEEYELVSPIPSSVTAGTTEMRVSPNSYSLSTPMYCDMTYYNSLGHDVDFMNSLYEYIKRLEERIKILESS